MRSFFQCGAVEWMLYLFSQCSKCCYVFGTFRSQIVCTKIYFRKWKISKRNIRDCDRQHFLFGNAKIRIKNTRNSCHRYLFIERLHTLAQRFQWVTNSQLIIELKVNEVNYHWNGNFRFVFFRAWSDFFFVFHFVWIHSHISYFIQLFVGWNSSMYDSWSALLVRWVWITVFFVWLQQLMLLIVN